MSSAIWMRHRARILALLLACVAPLLAPQAAAQDTKIQFQLDWRFEGPSALFLLAKAKGYFAQEKLDVTIDAGNGSGNAVNRVASGTYQMGFADLAALIEFVGNNPTAPSKPVAVMMVYDATPAAVFSLKKAGIKKPADLVGKKLGAPVFDAGRRAFPIFAKANNLDPGKVTWTSMDPPLRETMLAKGDVDAITGFYFTSLLNLNARGVKDEDIDVMLYPNNGVALYGNAIIASDTFLKEKPEAVRGFLRAFTRAARDVLADPDGSIKFVKERDALIDEALEKRRLKLAIESVIATPAAKADGLGSVQGPRLADMVTQVASAFQLKNPVSPEQVWNGTYLPPKADRMVFGK
jgi:NitT/TauT family transport system substrate-binding protein